MIWTRLSPTPLTWKTNCSRWYDSFSLHSVLNYVPIRLRLVDMWQIGKPLDLFDAVQNSATIIDNFAYDFDTAAPNRRSKPTYRY